jgi:hypothetical protein
MTTTGARLQARPAAPAGGDGGHRLGLRSASADGVLAALTIGVLAQGGYQRPGQLAISGTLILAVVLAARAAPPSSADLRLAPITAALALAGWAGVRGVTTGAPASGVPMTLLLLGIAAVLLVVCRLGDEDRRVLLSGLTGLGVLVALAGWVGVVWHVTPWGLTNDGLWRAASTLTYANATASVLVPLFLVSLGLLAVRPQDTVRSAVTAMLLTGAVATLSRAGMLSLVAGFFVLCALCGVRRVLAAGLAPVTGAAIAVGGLLVAMPLTSAPHQLVPVVGLPAGLLAAAALARWRPAPRGLLLLLAGFPVGVLLLARLGAVDPALGEVAQMRANASSPARVDATEAAARIVSEHPLVGVGPGDGWVRWSSEGGTTQTMQYVHDEYLQVLVELGVLGLALLLGLLVGGGLLARRAIRRDRVSPLPAAVAAALAAAALHGAFDFVWHLPVVPLVLGVLIGLLTEPTSQTIAGPTGPATRRRGELS